MKFSESALAHQLLDHLCGYEIGGSAHNPFNLPCCKNIDFTNDMLTLFKQNEETLCGEKLPVDIVAPGDQLPLPDESTDYIISSHVIEHFFDPIGALKEWLRVVKKDGIIFIIGPKQNAIPEEDRSPTQLAELVARHNGRMQPEEVYMGAWVTDHISGLPLNEHGHWSVWNLEDFLLVCDYLKLNVTHALETDDKVGNGWCVVIRK